jgi:hypothetical protein
MVGHELVERKTPNVASVGIAAVDIPAGAVPAVGDMHVTRRREYDPAVRQERWLAVGDRQWPAIFEVSVRIMRAPCAHLIRRSPAFAL